MNTVCIVIVGIAGLWCDANAEPIGRCINAWHGTRCSVQSHELSILLSLYDPAICNEHPTNCSDPNNPWQSATRLLTAANYGDYAACVADWLGKTIHINMNGASLWITCKDTGGDIHPVWRAVWRGQGGTHKLEYAWVIMVDVLWCFQETGWTWWSLREWDDWRFVPRLGVDTIAPTC